MVRTATIPTPQIDVNPPSVGRCLRSDLSAAPDGNSFSGYDSHGVILARMRWIVEVFQFAVLSPHRLTSDASFEWVLPNVH